MSPSTRRQFLIAAGALTGGLVAGGAILELSEGSGPGAGAPTGLVVAKLLVPPAIIVGETVTFGAVITNRRAVPTPAGGVLGVVFLVDGERIAWAGHRGLSLGPGASTTLFASAGGVDGAGAWTAVAGRHVVTATVTDVHRFPDAARTNASRELALAVAPTLPRVPLVTTGNAVPLAASATFVGNPQPTDGISTLTATVTSDTPFTLGLLESADGITMAETSVEAAARAGDAYVATVTVKPSQRFASIKVSNGSQPMTALAVRHERT